MKVEVLWREEGSAAAAIAARSTAPLAAAVRARQPALVERKACVVTGQQAGVLTGPLLTILKAARAVSLARELAQASGKPVVPLFWIASDDHDLDEIHHTFVLNGGGEAQKLRLELAGARGAAGEVVVPADGARLVKELWEVAGIDAAALPIEPFLPRDGDTLSSWFARGLLALFADHGLELVEPKQLGAAARPILERALRDGYAIARALQEGADALKSRGIEPPLPVESDPPLFWIEAGARTRIRRRGAELAIGERVLTGREADDLAKSCGPGVPRLSANVALRPIVQAATLAPVAYVSGPNEIVYYEQLRPLHALFDVPFPALVARPRATILPTAAMRALRKMEVAPRELFELLEKKEEAAGESPLLARGDSLRAEVGRYVDELLESSPAVKSAAARRAAQLLQSFDGLLERARAAKLEGARTGGLRHAQLRNVVLPRGKPQDRSLNVLPFVAQAPELIGTLLSLRGEPDGRGLVPHSLVHAEDGTNG
jgi:bacillithiol biosynthesis cysteine-adding enzyme BshC